jgi:hypothetical protein
MPYEIKERDGKYCVVKQGSDEVIPGGEHATEEQAQRHLAALEANVGDAKAANMADFVEASIHRDFTVFADGLFGDGKITRDERIALSGCIADALNAFHTKLHADCPQLVQRPPYSEVAESSKSTIAIPAYVKSLHLSLDEQRFKDVLACKFIGRDEVRGYSNLWGDEARVDLETEFFTPQTNFWDGVLGMPRPLTWNHAQDKSTFKATDVVGQIQAFGDDDVGRWYTAVLDRSHKYRQAVGKLIDQRVLGTSSDSAPQYVVREKRGKAVWLKQWPLFAAALTDVPCEPRMLDVGSPYWKSVGVDVARLEAEAEQAARRGRVALLTRRHDLLKRYV